MRSLLIVPPGDPSALPVALASGADALVVDAASASATGGPALFVRLPPLDAANALDALAEATARRPRGVALPMASGGADVQRLGARLAVEEARLGLPDGTFRILVFATETPQAIFGLSSYAGASARLEALVWSVAPLDAALGATRRACGGLRLARDLTLVAARAAGVFAIDAPAGDFGGLRAEASAAAEDGFDGKAAFAAAEIAVIHEIFARR